MRVCVCACAQFFNHTNLAGKIPGLLKRLWCHKSPNVTIITIPGGWTDAAVLAESDAGNRWADPGVYSITRSRSPASFFGNHSAPLSSLGSITAHNGMNRPSRIVKVFSKLERVSERERETANNSGARDKDGWLWDPTHVALRSLLVQNHLSERYVLNKPKCVWYWPSFTQTTLDNILLAGALTQISLSDT